MEDKIKLGISPCLLGAKVRYDGRHKMDHFLHDTLGRYINWVPVCPEVECGLPIPREAMRLVGTPESYRLVTVRTGVDHTDRMLQWAGKKLKELGKEGLCGFVFKSRSPSSGMRRVKIYAPAGMPNATGSGIFARVFMERFPLLPVEEEVRLNNPKIRENFIERIFVMKRWQEMNRDRRSIKNLIHFHTGMKLLVLSHSTKHYRVLGRLVGNAKSLTLQKLYDEYFWILMEGLRLTATVKKNTNVLQQMMGYFKKDLTHDEKEELSEVINQYYQEQVPLIVPLTLIKHYVGKHKEPYLMNQDGTLGTLLPEVHIAMAISCLQSSGSTEKCRRSPLPGDGRSRRMTNPVPYSASPSRPVRPHCKRRSSTSVHFSNNGVILLNLPNLAEIKARTVTTSLKFKRTRRVLLRTFTGR